MKRKTTHRHPHEETLEERARAAGSKVRHVIDGTTGEITEITENLETRIQEKPVQSSLIALGIGVLLGMLLRRR